MNTTMCLALTSERGRSSFSIVYPVEKLLKQTWSSNQWAHV
ncbi:hypothetical protein LINPERPRIM_LOCUS40990 [Linum perenne]